MSTAHMRRSGDHMSQHQEPTPEERMDMVLQELNWPGDIADRPMEGPRLGHPVATSSETEYYDGRCTCCPYGYHIDVDFVRYCDSLNDGEYLDSLKKIKRQKRELRKSMEMYLDQQARSGSSHSSVPPDVVHSTENFMHAVERDEHQTREILDEIDLLMHNGQPWFPEDRPPHQHRQLRAIEAPQNHHTQSSRHSDSHHSDSHHSDSHSDSHYEQSRQVETHQQQTRQVEEHRRRRRLVEETEETIYEIRSVGSVDEYDMHEEHRREMERQRALHIQQQQRAMHAQQQRAIEASNQNSVVTYENKSRHDDSDEYEEEYESHTSLYIHGQPQNFPPVEATFAIKGPPSDQPSDEEILIRKKKEAYALYMREMKERQRIEHLRRLEEERQRYRTETELNLRHAPPQAPVRSSESMSSLSSHSTFSNEQPPRRPPVTEEEEERHTSYMFVSNAPVARPARPSTPEIDEPIEQEPSAPVEAPPNSVSPEQLHLIREQMQRSLLRMRDLEEQLKAVPVLQTRLAVLKEEKRLLQLQLRAKDTRMHMRSVGVGSNIPYNQPTTDSRSIGIGDGDVHKQEVVESYKPKIHERELHTELTKHTFEKEKEVQTLLLNMDSDRLQQLLAGRRKPIEWPKVPQRSIGVGENDVFDTSSQVSVHEKETRTLIIGGDEKRKHQRNVGVMCKQNMRDVGVMYVFEDEKPSQRSVSCGVDGEMLALECPGGEGMSHTTINTQHMSLQQMNMAAFHSRNIHIKQEDLRLVLDEKLRKDVHSVGCMTEFSTKDKAVMATDLGEKHTVGCGEDTIDVVVKPVVQMHSVGIDNRPTMSNRLTMTERKPTRDVGTFAKPQAGIAKASNTDKQVVHTSATNTEQVHTYTTASETDSKIFQALDVIKNVGVNTPRQVFQHIAVNTDPEPEVITPTRDACVSTHNLIQYHHRANNTDMVRHISIGVGDFRVNEPQPEPVIPAQTTQQVMTHPSGPTSPRTDQSQTTREEVYQTTERTRYGSGSTVSRETKPVDFDSTRRGDRDMSSTTQTTVRTSRVGTERDTVPTRQGTETTTHTTTRYGSSLGRDNVDSVRTSGLSGGGQSSSTTETTVTRYGSGSSVGRDNLGSVRTTGLGGGEQTSSSSVTRTSITSRAGLSRRKQLDVGGMGITSDIGLLPSETSSTEQTTTTSSGGGTRRFEFSSATGTSALRDRFEQTSSQGAGSRFRESGSSRFQSSSLQSKQQSDDGQAKVQFQQLPDGGTQMKVIQQVETTYVGNQPVNKSSNVVVQESGSREFLANKQSTHQGHTEQTSRTSYGQQQSSSSSYGQHSSVRRHEEMLKSALGEAGASSTPTPPLMTCGPDGTIISQSSRSTDNGLVTTKETRSVREHPQRIHGRAVTVTESRVERRSVASHGRLGPEGATKSSLKSIMKQDKLGPKSKKELTFAAGVTGGYLDTTSSDEDGSDSEQNSDGSYEEGSYDGRRGEIVYKCQDDQKQASMGGRTFDENIRETYELGSDVRSSCEVYASWLDDSTTINTKQLNSSLNVIQQEWFKVSSHKTSRANIVEDYLTCFSEISRDLLEHIVNMEDANGNTSLHYAVSHCNLDIISLLLDVGSCDVNKQNKAGYSPVMLASLTPIQTPDHHAVVRRLFNMGDINMRASQAGQTALMLAVSHGRLDIVKLLLECGTDLNAQDDDGSTALMCACEHGHTDIVKLLLSCTECDPTIMDNDGSTAWSIAMEAGHHDVGVLLYAHVNFKPMASPETKRRIPLQLFS